MAGVILSGSTLYGTTPLGGANGAGEVYSVPVTGGTPTVLASFNGTSNGSEPYAGLILSGSTLFGTTLEGGAYGDGEVFSLPVTGGTPTVLASFDMSDGQDPTSALTLSGDTLFGTTENGGQYGYGEVFSVPIAGGDPNVLASFDISDGDYPYAGLIMDATGNLYGTTIYGGTNGRYGTVFELSTVPEPTSTCLIGLGCIVLLSRSAWRGKRKIHC